MWIKKQAIKFDVFMKILTLKMNDYYFGNVLDFQIPY
jgi:hypothetical protein